MNRTPEQLMGFGDKLLIEANKAADLGRTVKADIVGKPTDTELLKKQLTPQGRHLLEAVVYRAYADAFWVASGEGSIVELPSGRRFDIRMVGREKK